MTAHEHEAIQMRLASQYGRPKGRLATWLLELALPDGDIIRPDLIVVPDVHCLRKERPCVPLDRVLLVAEITSTASATADRHLKPSRCAQAGIPLYLLVDRIANPPTVTLFFDPAGHDYASWCELPAA